MGILDRVFGGRARPLLLNFLKVVSRHGRLDCLRAIHRQAHELYDQLRGRVRVRLDHGRAASTTPLAGRIAEQPPRDAGRRAGPGAGRSIPS